MFARTRSRTWKSCGSAPRRSETILISDWMTLQSRNSARNFKPACKMTQNISNMHLAQYAYLLKCSLLAFEEEMLKSLVAYSLYFEFQISQGSVATW